MSAIIYKEATAPREATLHLTPTAPANHETLLLLLEMAYADLGEKHRNDTNQRSAVIHILWIVEPDTFEHAGVKR